MASRWAGVIICVAAVSQLFCRVKKLLEAFRLCSTALVLQPDVCSQFPGVWWQMPVTPGCCGSLQPGSAVSALGTARPALCGMCVQRLRVALEAVPAHGRRAYFKQLLLMPPVCVSRIWVQLG